MVSFKEYNCISLLEESRYVHYLSFLDFETKYKKHYFTPGGLGSKFHYWETKKEYLSKARSTYELVLK